MPAFLRQSVYSDLADFGDVNDAERLYFDPTLRIEACSRAKGTAAATIWEVVRWAGRLQKPHCAAS